MIDEKFCPVVFCPETWIHADRDLDSSEYNVACRFIGAVTQSFRIKKKKRNVKNDTKKRILLCILLLLLTSYFSLFTVVYATTVKIEGRQLLVNGSTFTIKGVCYAPTPIGQGAGYDWSADANTYTIDFSLLKAMGANTIRTYGTPTATAAMDAAYNNGLYVIMGYWVNPGQDFGDTTVRNNLINGFKNMVSTWKDHPAVLMWAFGNEVWPGGSGTDEQKWSNWYSLVNEAAHEAKNIEGSNYHPVTTMNKDILETIGKQSYGSADSSMTALGCWGLNLYLGQNFSDRFEKYEAISAKPMFISEWGCDAYNGVTGLEDESTQELYIENLWKEIEQNLSSKDSNRVCLGGTVFEWCDEWWKSHTNSLGNSGHDTTTDWTNNNYSDPNMNEEWWGIVSQSAGTYDRTPRQAYSTLKTLWLACSTSTFATGTISGIVMKAADGTAISGAIVEVIGPQSIIVSSTTTSTDGNYQLIKLSTGTYDVRASAGGYQTAMVSACVVSGETTIVDFALLTVSISVSVVWSSSITVPTYFAGSMLNVYEMPIIVTNDGSVSESFLLSCSSATDMEAPHQDWSLSTSTPVNNTQFRVMTLFNNTVPSAEAFDPALDALNYNPQAAGSGSGRFYYTGDGGGFVPAGQSRNLWLCITPPRDTPDPSEHRFTISITAEQALTGP
jgi:hypothetical protein